MSCSAFWIPALTTHESGSNPDSLASKNQKQPTKWVMNMIAPKMLSSWLAPELSLNILAKSFTYLLDLSKRISLSSLISLTILCNLASLKILIHFKWAVLTTASPWFSLGMSSSSCIGKEDTRSIQNQSFRYDFAICLCRTSISPSFRS